MTKTTRFLLCCVVFLGSPCAHSATDAVSRSAPQMYLDHVADLLTPLDSVIKEDTSELKDEDVGGIVLVDEKINYLSESGRSLIVYHRAFKIINEAGVDAGGRSTKSFLRDIQTPHLVLAHTIRPDGSREDVTGEAAFIQTPQYLAQQGIFSDVGELVIVFPDVKPGHIIEYIVVIEQSEPRIPGHFSAFTSFASFWPVNHLNVVYDLPASTSGKLQVSKLGADIPDMKRTHPDPGRERLIWSDTKRKRLRWEYGREPSSHAGPSIWLTTWTSWNDVGTWFRGLTEGREELDDELKNLVDAWTSSLEDPDEILDVLFDHVSNDLRYVGLEFGLGALKPRSGPVVWRSQYGDCKDKANLLKAMLHYRGIEAYVVLLDTKHGGRIDIKSPSYLHFNHAIIAVERNGKLMFCDPTVEHSKPGVLPPGDSNRPVLVITETEGRIVQTPKRSAGKISYGFDMEVTATGTLKGWFKFSADEFYGAAYSDSFTNQDHQSQRENLVSIIQSFFPAAELIDFKTPDVNTPARCAIRAFFIVNGAYREPTKLRQLRLPGGGFILPDLGDNKTRETRYFQWIKDLSVRISYTLPQGWSLGRNPPQPLKVVAPGVNIDLKWSAEQQTITGAMLYSSHQNFIDPSSFVRLYQGVSSASSWLAEPVIVAPGDADADAVEDLQGISLPMMPSAEGQLSLVDHLYPYGGNTAMRRAALERVIQLFPDDESTVFNVQIQLAFLEYDDNKLEDAINRVEKILAHSTGSVDRDQIARARYVLSIFYADNGDTEKAKALLEGIIREDDLTPSRRAWAYYRLALSAADTNPESAIALIDKGLDLEAQDASVDLFELLATTEFKGTNSLSGLKSRLEKLLADNPQLSDTIFGTLAESAADWAMGDLGNQAAALVNVYEDLQSSHEDLDFLNDSLAPVRKILGSRAAHRDIAAKISDFIANSPPDWWADAAPDTTYSDLDTHLAALAEFSQRGFYYKWLRCDLELLSTHWNDLEDFSHRLWQLGAVVLKNEPKSQLFKDAISWCEDLPKDDSNYWEGRFLRGHLIEQSQDSEASRAYYMSIIDDPDTPMAFQMAAKIAIGKISEDASDWDTALRIYSELEKDRNVNVHSFDAFLRACHIRIVRGEYDEALRLIGLFSELVPADLEILEGGREIAASLKLAKAPEKARAWWAGYENWWPEWLELEEVLGLEPASEQISIKPIGDLKNFGYDIGVAKKENDTQRVFELYRRLVHATRYEPEMVAEISGVNSILLEAAPEHEDEIRALCVAMNRAVSSAMPHDEMAKMAEFQIAVQYTDWGKNAEGLKTVHGYLDRFPTDAYPGTAVIRIWAMLALRAGQEREEAALALEEQLKTIDMGSNRGYSVNLLGKLYLALGRPSAELELLKDEVDGARLAPNDSKLEDLKTRLTQLKNQGDESLKFSAAVDDWLKKHRPPWFDFAHPADVKDPIISDIETTVSEGSHELSDFELIKLRLLVAIDPSYALQLRQTALVKAADKLADIQSYRHQAREIRDEIINDERFGLAPRTTMLWYAAFEAFFNHDAEAVEQYTTHELIDFLPVSAKGGYATLKTNVVDDPYDSEQIFERISAILGDTVDVLELFIYRSYLDDLLRVGAIDKVEQLAGAVAKIRLAAEVKETKTTLLLEFKRRIRNFKNIEATARSMANIVLEHYPAPEKKPAGLDDLQEGNDSLRNLDKKTAFDIRLWRLKHEIIDPKSFFWSMLIRDLHSFHCNSAVLEKLVRTNIRGAHDDEDRSWAIQRTMFWLDMDDEDVRTTTQEIFSPYRDPQANPDSFDVIRLIEIYTAIRTGNEVHLEKELGNLNPRIAGNIGFHWLVRYYLQRKDIPSLKRVLRAADPEELVKPSLVSRNLEAARLSGLEDEAELIEEVAQETLYDSILEAWARVDVDAASRAMKIAKVLYDAPEYPREWLRDLLHAINNEEALSVLQMRDAELRKDWMAAATFATQILDNQPTLYDLYWNLGRAQAELGQKRNAIKSLKTFTKYSKDHIDHPRALEMLKELQK